MMNGVSTDVLSILVPAGLSYYILRMKRCIPLKKSTAKLLYINIFKVNLNINFDNAIVHWWSF